MRKEVTEEGIKELVHTFYDKIRMDEKLAPVFNQAIPAESWPKHLNTMCDFWSSLVLKTGRYEGNPLQKHLQLPKFEKELFDRWLELFSETAHEIFEEDSARTFDLASQNIARSFKYMLYDHPIHKS